MQVNVKRYPVEILTGHYQIGGELEIRGSPAIFINDAAYSTLNVVDATLLPLAIGSPVGSMQIPLLLLPKSEPQVLLIGDYSPKEAQLLANKIKLVAFTDTYVIRGAFHTGPETGAQDLFVAVPGPYFPATDAEIYPLRPLAADLGGQADLVFVHKDAIRVFHEY